MGKKIRVLTVLQNVVFVLISLFYCIFGDVFFGSRETIDSLFVNNLVNMFFGSFFIVMQFPKRTERIAEDLGFASGLFIAYNLIPVLLLQKSMFGFLILAEIVLVIFTSASILFTEKSGLSHSTGERILYALIVLLFSVIFIGRSAVVFAGSGLSKINLEIAVGISDTVICLIWFVVSVLFLSNRKTGNKLIYPVIIQASLLFLTLVIYMILHPVIFRYNIDLAGLVVILSMAAFFFVPMIILTVRKLS